MTGRPPVPEALRRAMATSGPVRPLARPTARASWLLLWLGGALTLVLALGLRPDLAEVGLALSWGATTIECAAGLALVALAARESVPGSGVTLPGAIAAIAAGAAANAAVAILTWLRRGMPTGTFPPSGGRCLPFETALGLPALAIALVLVARAYAVRPRRAGLLGGAGAGLLADGVWHLACPFADLAHVLVAHTGAVVALALAGWASGAALERVRLARLARR